MLRSTNCVVLCSLWSLHHSYTFGKCVHSTEHIIYTAWIQLDMQLEVKCLSVTCTYTHYDKGLFRLNIYLAKTCIIQEVALSVYKHNTVKPPINVFLITNVKYNLSGGNLIRWCAWTIDTEHWSKGKSYIQERAWGFHCRCGSCYLNSGNLWEILSKGNITKKKLRAGVYINCNSKFIIWQKIV